METSNEAISVRTSRLNNLILSKCNVELSSSKRNVITRESLLDALTVLYDECNNDFLKKSDKNMVTFTEKFRQVMQELRKMRVNMGDFDVRQLIGRGRFGEVHLVRERHTGDFYAMKTLRKSETLNSSSSFYEEERDIMARSKSELITSLYCAFQDKSNLYLVMEYHPGGDLFALMHRHGGVLSEEACVFYLAEITQGLNALHSMKYVHRDLKPENILLDRCGHVKLVDFGLAMRLNSDGQVTGNQMPVGTCEYVAPEVLKSVEGDESTAKYGVECDYWSMGVLAYELITGCAPFKGDSATIIYNNILNHKDNPLSFPKDVSENYKIFVRQLLCAVGKRLNYKKIVEHPLFKDIDWTTLLEQVPPFVPKVDRPDDTSNFASYEPKTHVPSIDNLKKKITFSGRNLPFIGFSFTKDVETDLESSFRSTSSTKSQLETKKKEIELLQKRLVKSEAQSKDVEDLNKRLNNQIKKYKELENARSKLEHELALSNNKISHLKRTLEAERLERVEVETKALDMIKTAQKRWNDSENERIAALLKQQEESNERITKLCTLNNELNDKVQRYDADLKKASRDAERYKYELSSYQGNLAKQCALSRRSVADVSLKIDKLTNDNQEQVDELKNKLAAEIERHARVQKKLNAYESTENDLKMELDVVKTENKKLIESVNALKSKHDAFESSIQELSRVKLEFERFRDAHKLTIDDLDSKLRQEKMKCEEKVKMMEKNADKLKGDLRKNEQDFNLEKSQLITRLDSLTHQLEQLKSDRELLQAKLKDSEDTEEKLRAEIDKLKEFKQNDKEKIERGDLNLDEKLRLIEAQLETTQEQLASEKQSARQARIAMRQKDKQLSDCELDKKIVERELKTANETIKSLNAELTELNKQMELNKQNADKQIDELESKLKESQEQMASVQMELTKENRSRVDDKSDWQSEKKILLGTIDRLKRYEEENVKQRESLVKVEKEKNGLKMKLNDVETNKRLIEAVCETLKKEKLEVDMALSKQTRELESLKLNHSMLRDACTMFESQLDDYERILTTHQSKIDMLESEKCELKTQLDAANEEIKRAKCDTNEEKSLRLLSEQKLKRSDETINDLKTQNESLSKSLKEYKVSCEKMSENLSVAEETICELNGKIGNLERLLVASEQEETQLKEERSRILTNMYALKEANLKLTRELEEYKENESQLEQRLTKVETTLQEQLSYYQTRETKFEGTIAQQTKLINYLHAKLEEQSKKKGFMNTIFGTSKKENVAPTHGAQPSPQAYKELELKLMHEKMKTKNLSERVKQLQEKLKSFDEKMEKLDTMVTDSMERGGRKKTEQKDVDAITISDEKPTLDGWLKILNGSKWDKVYVKLINFKLYIATNDAAKTALSVYDLSPSNTPELQTTIEPTECGNPVSSDVPFIFKITLGPRTTCWPNDQTIFLMALSDVAKTAWLTALRQIISDKNDAIGELIAKFNRDINKVFCTHELERNVVLLGCDTGLYAVEKSNSNLDKKFVKIHDGSVKQIATCPVLGQIMFILNDNIYKTNLRSVENRAKSNHCESLNSLEVVSSESFTMFELSHAGNDVMMCGVTLKQLILFKYNEKINNFIPVKILNTPRPCCSIMFRQYSLIFASHNIFEMDLRSQYRCVEFLDESDNTLAHVSSAHKCNSFPLAVIDVTIDAKTGGEFLVCYPEFGVFVDEYGRRNRDKDLQWKHSPIRVIYRAPYLYLLYANGLDLWRIDDDRVDEKCSGVKCRGLKYLGFSTVKPTSIYVQLDNELRLVHGHKLADESFEIDETDFEDDVTSVSSGDARDGGDSETFSITTSLAASLDRLDSRDDSDCVSNLSEKADEMIAKSVTFKSSNDTDKRHRGGSSRRMK